MGDFIGFTFDGFPNQDFGIVRVSDGDRYTEQLQPEIKDITAEVPGMNGEYYFGSTYGTKEFEINIAYDSITEEQFRKLKKVFSQKGIHELIFDERPYKKYLVKLTSPIELSFVCFDVPKRRAAKKPTQNGGIRVVDREYEQVSEITASEGLEVNFSEVEELEDGTYTFTYSAEQSGWLYEDEVVDLENYNITVEGELKDGDIIKLVLTTIVSSITHESITPWVYELDEEEKLVYERIYKGEGTISLIAYYPFAKSAFKVLPDISEYSNVNDWASSSGLLTADERSNKNIDIYKTDNNSIAVYNAGDIATGFRLYIPSTLLNQNISILYKKHHLDLEPDTGLYLKAMTMKKNGKSRQGQDVFDEGVLIDTNNQLIVGVIDIAYDSNNNSVYNTSGNIYNEFVDKGSFFHLEPNESKNDGSMLIFENGGEGIDIFYDYLYV